MRIVRTACLTGAAAILLAGYAGIADAEPPATHVMTLGLPDGRQEQIRYAGDVRPTVVVSPGFMTSALDPGFPFGMLDQMAAAIDRQAADMFRMVEALPTYDAGGFGAIPVFFGPGVCMPSVQITYTGNGRPPHVGSQTSGDCGVAHGDTTPSALPAAPVQKPAPNVIQAKATPPYQGLIHTVGDWQR